MSERSTWWHLNYVTPSGFTQNSYVMQQHNFQHISEMLYIISVLSFDISKF